MWIAAIIFCGLMILISLISIKLPFLAELLAKLFLSLAGKHQTFDIYGEVLQAVLEVNQYAEGVGELQIAIMLINAFLDAILMGSINFAFRASFASVTKKGIIHWPGPVVTVISVIVGLLITAGKGLVPLPVGTVFTLVMYIGCVCLGIGMMLRWPRSNHYRKKDRNSFRGTISSAVGDILMGSVSSMACLAIITNTLLGPSLICDKFDFGEWISFYFVILGCWALAELVLYLKYGGNTQ